MWCGILNTKMSEQPSTKHPSVRKLRREQRRARRNQRKKKSQGTIALMRKEAIQGKDGGEGLYAPRKLSPALAAQLRLASPGVST